MRFPSVHAGLLAVTLVAGCALRPATLPDPVLPASFDYADATPGTSFTYASFGSPQLDGFLREAARENQDLAAAVARVKQADARSRQSGAALLPEVSADLAATVYDGGTHGTTAHETDWSALLTASYELDFWGKNRAARDSAGAAAQASRADLETVRITLMTDVAATYFQIQSLRERIELARSNLQTARDLLQFIQLRVDRGLLGPLDLAAQRALVANAELLIPPLEQQEVDARTSLAVLIGRAPEGFLVDTQPLEALKEPPIGAGVPGELLQRRPDLRSAEHALRAANADVQVARAAMYPSLTLTAGAGIANPAVQAAVVTLAGTGYSLTAGADLVQTVFDNGRRRAVTREVTAREEELLANYRGAILAALGDVEKSLAEMQHLDAQAAAEQESVTQSERAFDGAQRRYREGAAEYVTVLESQRLLYAAREQRGEYLLSRFQALLGLTKALGGGWEPAMSDRP